jgi:hypothetical protein
MKVIDKFLKYLNTDRNTFATYILTLFSVYFAVDRIVEILLMIFTGVSWSYWGPLMYTFALACPVFAFLFALQSQFATSKSVKVTLFYLYIIDIYIMAISMFTQWLNMGAWLLFMSVPNYSEIIVDFSDLVKPAFTALSLYIPLVTIFPLIKRLFLGVNDSSEMIRSIWDYGGIGLTKNTEGTGPYSYELFICKDKESGQAINFPGNKRYQPMLVCGAAGSGKTTLVLEPLMSRDLYKKYFFREVSKEMGFNALKNGIAVLECPYGNEYINQNFKLNMLKPAFGKDTAYKTYMKKMILSSEMGEIIYKDLGITYITPDYETISHMVNVCENMKLNYNVVDPTDRNSQGLNPFVYDSPSKIAMIISSVLKGMYKDVHTEADEAYKEDISIQAIENLTILLKEMYPRMNDGALPNLEDLLKLLINFDLVEKMCKILENDEALAKKYEIQLGYFKRSFYKDGSLRQETEKYVYTAVTQLDNLLRLPGVKNILCSRRRNINFDEMLERGEITFVCTRRGELGATSHKAFGLFYILSMQNSVLARPGIEETRIPNYIYIDEFPEFLCKAIEPMFTMYRKYRASVIIAIQNLAQLGEQTDATRQMILGNCTAKIFTGGTTPEEAEWWEKEFNRRRKWKYSRNMDGNKLAYTETMGGISYDWEDYFKSAKLLALSFKSCAYEIPTQSRPAFGEGSLNFLEAKYKEEHKVKIYDFDKYNDAKPQARREIESPFDLKNKKHFDSENNPSPVMTNTDDLTYVFDNEDAITMTWKVKGKKKKD